ncbi:hypothetical protein AK88_01691 [Plasmodium fragile]|uniref:Uncharacterized protein n=1 Tax=Plasmodium fragile TaxID=5857 RepID=A0A0D9QSL8_PLAFR|nr:uncharacterized protein AK88_01691 [Plasmodium fragile]KJP88611.1 hypothetical protein AK88_01691 [Plasmodium fragile]
MKEKNSKEKNNASAKCTKDESKKTKNLTDLGSFWYGEDFLGSVWILRGSP